MLTGFISPAATLLLSPSEERFRGSILSSLALISFTCIHMSFYNKEVKKRYNKESSWWAKGQRRNLSTKILWHQWWSLILSMFLKNRIKKRNSVNKTVFKWIFTMEAGRECRWSSSRNWSPAWAYISCQ